MDTIELLSKLEKWGSPDVYGVLINKGLITTATNAPKNVPSMR